MKKRFLSFISLYLFFMFVPQSNLVFVSAQTVSITPHEVFVGDVAEIRYDFECPFILCSETAPIQLDGDHFFSNAWDPDSKLALLAQKNFDILFARLVVNSSSLINTYTLLVKITPWTTGNLDIPPFNIIKAFGLEKKISTMHKVENPSFIVDIPAVKISSIIDKTQKKVLQPSAGPVVIPGTTWIVYGLLILVVLFFLVFIFFILRFKKIYDYLRILVHKISLAKNYRLTLKKLSMLEKKTAPIDAQLFASEVSTIVRSYLQYRFNYNFMAVETSKLCTVFNVITGETASNKAQSAIEEIQAVFIRLDFIKFSGSVATLEKNMSTDLLKRVYTAIAYFEKQEDDENEF